MLPREKMLSFGPAMLSNYELIAAILGSGTAQNPVLQMSQQAAQLLAKIDSTWQQQLAGLESIAGVSKTRAIQLVAAMELGRRMVLRSKVLDIKFAREVIMLAAEIASLPKEHLLMITINGGRELIAKHIVTTGTLNATLIHPREVFSLAIADRAAGIYLIHNHPSGIIKPSTQDLTVTIKLREAGELLGIPLLDHFIVTARGEVYSIIRENTLP